MPAGLWFLFVGFALPMICLASMLLRASFFYFAVRDTCYKAAKSQSFTQAQTNANAAWTADVAAWTGLSGTQTTQIVVQSLSTNNQTTSTVPLATVDTQNNLYFIKIIGTGTISPLVAMTAPPFGLNIPGLTAPYNLTMIDQKYAENPNGLTN